MRLRLVGDEDSQAVADAIPMRQAFSRRWSPLLVPVALGGFACAAALVWALRGPGVPSTLLVEGGMVEVLSLALVGAALLGVLLYAATSEASWLAVLVAGGVLYVASIFAAVLGIVPGIVLVGGAAFAAFTYARRHVYNVPDGAVLLTTRRGQPFRALYPGFNLFWPRERTLGLLETGQRIHTSPTQAVRICAPDGTRYRVSAAAVVAYAIIPREAQATAPVYKTWEHDLRQHVHVALAAALESWSTREVLHGGAVPAGGMARAVLEAVRGHARDAGIWIAWVRVCHIRVERVSDSDVPRGYYGVPSDYFAAQPRASTPLRARAQRHAPSVAPAVMLDADEARDEDEALSPDALADTYAAVREGRIRDPETIRAIAQAFAQVAQGPEGDLAYPYDAARAADQLLEYAAKLEQRSRGSQPSWPGGDGSPWQPAALNAPTRTLPLHAAAYR